jgi:Radical SAM superfamily
MATSLSFLWLEITGRCQLACDHCYAGSGPWGDQGSMGVMDWIGVIDQAWGLGVRRVQFIGGEPTLHPDLPAMVTHALGRSLEVEVYTNLVRVTPELWTLFKQPGVRLATSYYSPLAAEHDAITRRRSHDRTLSNILGAVQRGIPLRVGVIGVREGQQTQAAVAQLRALGVEDVDVDHLREVGRGVRQQGPGIAQLCGECAEGKLAISAAGEAWPCVFSRWLCVGNLHSASLQDLDRRAEPFRRDLKAAFAARPKSPCVPPPGSCEPVICTPTCHPACTPSR